MSNILTRIEEANYQVTDEEAETLIATEFRAGLIGKKLGGGFYNLLQRRFLDERFRVCAIISNSEEEDRRMLDKVYKPLYEIVKRVTLTEDVKPLSGDCPEVKREKALERNRRTNFARSARNTILAGIKAGSDIVQWEHGDLATKTAVLAYAKSRQEPKSFDAIQQEFERKLERHLAWCNQQGYGHYISKIRNIANSYDMGV